MVEILQTNILMQLELSQRQLLDFLVVRLYSYILADIIPHTCNVNGDSNFQKQSLKQLGFNPFGHGH